MADSELCVTALLPRGVFLPLVASRNNRKTKFCVLSRTSTGMRNTQEHKCTPSPVLAPPPPAGTIASELNASPPHSQHRQRLGPGKPACGFIAFFTWTGYHGFLRMQPIGGNVGNLETYLFSTASSKNVYQGKRGEMPLRGPSPINLGRVRRLLVEKLHCKE